MARLYAVRSSGIDEDGVGHSFAGIHETHLNVSRGELVEAVLVCRRSGGSEQAVAYRQSRHLESSGAIGVFVQRMVPAAASGVAFTINPITSANELVINAAPVSEKRWSADRSIRTNTSSANTIARSGRHASARRMQCPS
jgi:pyruvate,water dikinase